ncbi:MAG: hypothetical protein RDV48_23975 [Candidatus Eremiobacteraeota bacterium]|nr:hypothetical protein [Candidatus Eremiobacteraeota bacterium]
MGLEEKRVIKKLQEEVLPRYHDELAALAGREIPVTVAWESFSEDLRAMKFFENQGLKYMVSAVKAVCKDDIGREAVNKGLKEIKFVNLDDPAGCGVTFAGGVVLVKGSWAKAGYPQEGDIRKAIENGL